MPKAAAASTPYKMRAPETINVAPVQNQWYTVCDLYGDLVIYTVWLLRFDDDAIAKTVVAEITIDENVFTYSFSANNGAQYWLYCHGVGVGGLWETIYAAPFMVGQNLLCSHLKFRVRITSAIGTNAGLQASVHYSSR